MSNWPLQEMAPHLGFEIERLRFVANHQNFMDGSNHGAVLGESFLLHFRNLIDFFYTPGKYPTDVVASHYTDSNSSWTPNTPAWLKDDKERCNKLLSHLTYDRVTYAKNDELKWKRSFRDQAAHLLSEWDSFLASLHLTGEHGSTRPGRSSDAVRIVWIARIGKGLT
jgi:hypothetical protein